MEKIQDLPGEVWKQIKDCENYYVSNMGRVYSKKTHRLLKGRLSHAKVNGGQKGYYRVYLPINHDAYIHRLVAEAFCEIPKELEKVENLVVNHKNENPLDNRAENLEWLTLQQNFIYGTARQRRKEGLPQRYMQFTKDGKLVSVWFSSTEPFGKEKAGNISRASFDPTRFSAYGFKWAKVKNEDVDKIHCLNDYIKLYKSLDEAV